MDADLGLVMLAGDQEKPNAERKVEAAAAQADKCRKKRCVDQLGGNLVLGPGSCTNAQFAGFSGKPDKRHDSNIDV